MKKVVRDGMVAVLYSPEFGAGWYSWNKDYPQCLFSPEIVQLVEENRQSEITEELCMGLFNAPNFYIGGAEDLEIKWLPEGTAFDVGEYDGSESITTFEDIKLIA